MISLHERHRSEICREPKSETNIFSVLLLKWLRHLPVIVMLMWMKILKEVYRLP
jgi:hypothetical protein